MEQHLWLSGSGRSGTTWLQRILVTLTDGRPLFEPLHPQFVTLPANLTPPMRHTNSRPYLTPTSDAPTWEAFIHRLLMDPPASPWLDEGWVPTRNSTWRWHWQRWRRTWQAKAIAFKGPLVIKSIRSTLMLGWLLHHFSLRPLFIVRHPCAVLASQARHGWFMNIRDFLQDHRLVTDHLAPYHAWLQNLRGVWAQRAAFWAIENRIALATARDYNIPIIMYEHLLLDPESHLRHLFERLDLVWPAHRWQEIVAREKLILPREEAEARLVAWQSELSTEQQETILEVVHHLGVHLYDEHHVIPEV